MGVHCTVAVPTLAVQAKNNFTTNSPQGWAEGATVFYKRGCGVGNYVHLKHASFQEVIQRRMRK